MEEYIKAIIDDNSHISFYDILDVLSDETFCIFMNENVASSYDEAAFINTTSLSEHFSKLEQMIKKYDLGRFTMMDFIRAYAAYISYEKDDDNDNIQNDGNEGV